MMLLYMVSAHKQKYHYTSRVVEMNKLLLERMLCPAGTDVNSDIITPKSHQQFIFNTVTCIQKTDSVQIYVRTFQLVNELWHAQRPGRTSACCNVPCNPAGGSRAPQQSKGQKQKEQSCSGGSCCCVCRLLPPLHLSTCAALMSRNIEKIYKYQIGQSLQGSDQLVHYPDADCSSLLRHSLHQLDEEESKY